jgi:hypothetical protein
MNNLSTRDKYAMRGVLKFAMHTWKLLEESRDYMREVFFLGSF